MANVRLDWPANPPSELVHEYEVWEQLNDGFFNVVATVPNNFLERTLNTPGVYHWKVKARNLAGDSGFSAVTDGPSVPSTPGTITVTVL